MTARAIHPATPPPEPARPDFTIITGLSGAGSGGGVAGWIARAVTPTSAA